MPGFVFFVFVLATVANANEGPVSVTTLGGTNALFHCNGSGTVLAWEVDGQYHTNDQTITDRGITEHTVSSSGTVQSTLTVPATSVNNGTTVRCFIGSSLFSLSVVGNYSTLTILPGGIGQVVNVRFTPSLSAVLWDPPATVGVLSGLSYIVIVMNNNTGRVIVSDTTTNTNYPLPAVQQCQYYTANVTAFSSEHHSDSVVTGQRTPGEYYDLKNVSRIVVANYSTNQSAVTFTINIEQRNVQVCPGQNLMTVTYPTANIADRNSHDEMSLQDAGEVNYTAIVKSGYHCACDIKIIVDDIEIDIRTVLFSSYNVQDCDVSTDHTSILVECTFAINSTAPGIVVIQDDQSQYTINKTLQRLQQDSDKGSVNITGLPAGEYSVRVYDNNIISPATDTAAYEHSQLLHIMGPPTGPSPSLSSTILPSATSTSVLILSSSAVVLSSSVTPSVVLESTGNNIVTVFAVVCVIVIVITIFIVVIVMMASIKLRAHKKIRLVPVSVETMRWSNEDENRYVDRRNFSNSVSSTNPLVVEDSVIADSLEAECGNNHDSTYMEPIGNFLPTPPTVDGCHNMNEQPMKQQEPVYADLHHSTNPPAPPLPAELVPVQYATVQKQTDNTVTIQSDHVDKMMQDPVDSDLQQSTTDPPPCAEPVQRQEKPNELLYAEVQHSATKRPAPPLPAELVPVHYASVQKQTDNTVTTQPTEDKVIQDQVDADLHYSTNSPAAPPLPAKPTIKKQTDNIVTVPVLSQCHDQQKEPVLRNPPAPPLPAELATKYEPSKSKHDSGKIKQPDSCEGSSSGYYSGSVPTILPAESTGSESTGPESTGPDIAVFLQTSPYRPYNSQFASTGLLSSDIKDSTTVPYHHQSMESTDNNCSQFIHSPFVRTNTPPVVEARGGDMPTPANKDSHTGSLSHFQCVSEKASLDEESSPSEADEETSLPASEQTAPVMRFCSGMEHYSLLKQGQLLLTVTRPVEISRNNEMVVGNSAVTRPENEEKENLPSVQSLSFHDAPPTVDQPSPSKQPHGEMTGVSPSVHQVSCFLEGSSSNIIHDDQDVVDEFQALQPVDVLPSHDKLKIIVIGRCGAGKSALLSGLIEATEVSDSVARVLVCCQDQTSADAFVESYVETMSSERHSLWSVKLARNDWYSDNSEFVPLQVFQQDIRDAKYANTKRLVVVTTPENIESLLETDFFTHVLLDEGAHVLEEVRALLNKKTKIDGSDSALDTKKMDDNSSPPSDGSFLPPVDDSLSLRSDDSLLSPVDGSLSFPSDHSPHAMLKNESPAVKSDKEAAVVECPSVAATNSAQNTAAISVTDSLRTDAKRTLADYCRLITDVKHTLADYYTALQSTLKRFSPATSVIAQDKSVSERLQALKLSLSHILADFQSHLVYKRRHLYYHWLFPEECMCKLCQDSVDTFNTYHLEESLASCSFAREDINHRVKAYKQERDQFMESTTVLEFQQAVSERDVPEGKDSVKITVSKKWAKAKTLKDVMILAQRAFGDNYKSLISFNVVSRRESILISWFFPKRLKTKLHELAVTNAFVFRQQDVDQVTVGEDTVFRKFQSVLFQSLFSSLQVTECATSLYLPLSHCYCDISTHSKYTSRTSTVSSLSKRSPTLKELDKACKNVYNWFLLGLHLRLSVKQLKNIRKKYYRLGEERMKTIMFEVWLKSSPGASWADLIDALNKMGEDSVSSMVEAANTALEEPVSVRQLYWYRDIFRREASLFSHEREVILLLERLMCKVERLMEHVAVLIDTKRLGVCRKLMWSLRKYGPPHGVFRMLFHFKWPFKEIVQSIEILTFPPTASNHLCKKVNVSDDDSSQLSPPQHELLNITIKICIDGADELLICTHNVQNAGSCSTHSNCSLNCDFAQEHQIQGCVFKFIDHDDTNQQLAPVIVHHGEKELYELESKLFQQREDEELPSEMSNDSNKTLHTEVATVQPGGAIGYAEKRCYWASDVKVVTYQRKVHTTKTVTFSCGDYTSIPVDPTTSTDEQSHHDKRLEGTKQSQSTHKALQLLEDGDEEIPPAAKAQNDVKINKCVSAYANYLKKLYSRKCTLSHSIEEVQVKHQDFQPTASVHFDRKEYFGTNPKHRYPAKNRFMCACKGCGDYTSLSVDSTSTDKWSQHDKRLLLLERDDEAIKLFGSVIAVSLYMILFLHLAIITALTLMRDNTWSHLEENNNNNYSYRNYLRVIFSAVFANMAFLLIAILTNLTIIKTVQEISSMTTVSDLFFIPVLCAMTLVSVPVLASLPVLGAMTLVSLPILCAMTPIFVLFAPVLHLITLVYVLFVLYAKASVTALIAMKPVTVLLPEHSCAMTLVLALLVLHAAVKKPPVNVFLSVNCAMTLIHALFTAPVLRAAVKKHSATVLLLYHVMMLVRVLQCIMVSNTFIEHSMALMQLIDLLVKILSFEIYMYISRSHTQQSFFSLNHATSFGYWTTQETGLKYDNYNSNSSKNGLPVCCLTFFTEESAESDSCADNAEEDGACFNDTWNKSGITNKSTHIFVIPDLPFITGKAIEAMSAGAASLISDMELLFSRLTEVLPSINIFSTKTTALPTGNSFADQLKNLVGGQLLQLTC